MYKVLIEKFQRTLKLEGLKWSTFIQVAQIMGAMASRTQIKADEILIVLIRNLFLMNELNRP